MTIQDIARLAGVSPATVSGVLNDSPLVNARTKARILAIIEQHKYKPNQVARALALRHTGIIGLLVKDISNPLYSKIALGVEEICEQKMYNVIIGNTHKEWQREVSYVNILKQRRMDGLILFPLQKGVDLGHIHELKKDRYPFVLLAEVPGIETDVIRADDEQGAFLATQHLIRLGRRTIAYITGPASALASDRRRNGYQAALTAHDLLPKPQLVWPGGWCVEDGYRAGMNFCMSPGFCPDGILCYNDSVAIGFIRALQERNLHVPDDVAVIGFDDAGFGAYLETALTTVAQPALAIGQKAAELLLERIGQKGANEDVQKVFLPTQLVIRESCGGLAKGSYHSSMKANEKHTEHSNHILEVST
jgi:DNA-binding LacI/PurR family transcriptional regulator